MTFLSSDRDAVRRVQAAEHPRLHALYTWPVLRAREGDPEIGILLGVRMVRRFDVPGFPDRHDYRLTESGLRYAQALFR